MANARISQKAVIKRKTLPNKKKQLPPPKPWPHNLPQNLSILMARKLYLMQNITRFRCVTKSWRSPPKKCINYSHWPHLVEINLRQKYPFCFYRGKYEEGCNSGIYFKGLSNGQKMQLFSDWIIHFLPDWDRNRVFKTYDLSLEKNGLSTVMVITGSSSPAFALFRYNWVRNDRREWIIPDCDVKEPYLPSQNIQFSNAIGFRGKFYALSLQGSLVVIEVIEGHWGVTAMGGNRAVTSKFSRWFKECLVEFNGEILLVFLISGKCIDVVDDVEVFRLDFEKLLWVRVESLGDRTLFLEDECCMWVDARMVGCKKNCVYFSHFRVDKWWRFDMGSGRIEPACGSGVKECE